MNRNTLIPATVALSIASVSLAQANDSYDTDSRILTMESVSVGASTFKNVAVQITGYNIQGVDGGQPQSDSFDPATGILRMGRVGVGGTTYTNARVQVTGYSIISGGNTPVVGNLGGIAYADNEQAGYALTLNAARTACGIPALAQNSILDNGTVVTGSGALVQGVATVMPGDYANASRTAGYAMADSVGAIGTIFVTQWSGVQPTDISERLAVGQYSARIAMADPYGLLMVMRPFTEIGTRYTFTQNTKRTITTAFGNPQTTRTTTGNVVTYPCANTTDAVPAYAGYSSTELSYVSTQPNAAIASAGWSSSSKGSPVAVFANEGELLALTAATITAADGTVIPVELRDNWHVQSKIMKPNEGLVVPTAALQPNTTYNVVISYTATFKPYSKRFSFRTGAAVPMNPV